MDKILLLKNEGIKDLVEVGKDLVYFFRISEGDLNFPMVEFVQKNKTSKAEKVLKNFNLLKDDYGRIPERLSMSIGDYMEIDLDTQTVFEWALPEKGFGLRLMNVVDYPSENCEVEGYAAFLDFYNKASSIEVENQSHQFTKSKRLSLFEVADDEIKQHHVKVTNFNLGKSKNIKVWISGPVEGEYFDNNLCDLF